MRHLKLHCCPRLPRYCLCLLLSTLTETLPHILDLRLPKLMMLRRECGDSGTNDTRQEQG